MFSDASAPAPAKVIQAYCPFNLGDHVYNFFLFYHINHILVRENIWVEYRCRGEYHSQLSEFIPNPVQISILGYNGEQDNIGVRMHIASPHLRVNLDTRTHTNFDGFYLEYYPQILANFNLPAEIYNECITPPPPYSYTDIDLLLRYESLPRECKNIDVLIINSAPRSGQYLAYFPHKQFWDRYISYLVLRRHLNVITTEKVAGVKCTTDYNLSLKNIGAISTQVKVIIAINTGPLSPCYNTYTLENVRRIYMFHDKHTHIHPKVVQPRALHDINPDEIVGFCRATA